MNKKDIKINDIVCDKENVIFEVLEKRENSIYVRGIRYRIYKWLDLNDVSIPNKEVIEANEMEENRYFHSFLNKTEERVKHVSGKILHIDGDNKYLRKCLDLYEELEIYAYGVCIKEEDIAKEILKYYYKVLPDVIVITGHDLYNSDGIKNIENYTNTRYYIEAIKKVRKIDKSVIIIAGACQSNFEALIASGADFASSPARINIHTFDPAVIAVKAATTPVTKIINFNSVIKYIENGNKAFGGLETFGKMRLLL